MCCHISVGDVFVEPQMIYININPLTFNMFSEFFFNLQLFNLKKN